MMRFLNPHGFLLLLLLPPVFWARWRWGRPATLRYPWLAEVRLAGRTWRQRLLWLPDGLRLAALILVIVALARPQAGMEKLREVREGIAIEMVLDRSPSMVMASMEYDGRQLTRLDTVKEVFAKFVFGDGHGLKGRPDDLIGIVSFSGVADTICPLTLSHEVFRDYLKTVLPPVVQAEQGTAIGDAVALAGARLQKIGQPPAKETPGAPASYQVKSRVMILLSDGSNNRGALSPFEAAGLAAKWGVKVYAIGIGDANDWNPETRVDQATLKQLADKTGGRYWLATDGQVLEKVCREIDQLEKTKVESTRFVDYRELFPCLVWLALGLLALEIGLRTTVLRRLP
jgi:Ca-activated chloride channel family protein